MAATAVRVGKKVFIAGLIWQYLGKNLSSNSIKTLAQELECQRYFKHKTLSGQVGFLPNEDEKEMPRCKVYAMAAALASRFGSRWLGIFQVDEQHAYVLQVSHHVVSPLTDKILPNSIAVSLVHDLLEKQSDRWEAVINFEHFGLAIPDTRETLTADLANLLDSDNIRVIARAVPKDLTLHQQIAVVIFVFLTMICAWGGYYFYQAHQEALFRDKQAMLEAHRQQLLSKKKAFTSKTLTQREKKVIPEWEAFQDPVAFLEACLEAIEPNGRGIGFDWTLNQAHCTQQQAILKYSSKNRLGLSAIANRFGVENLDPITGYLSLEKNLAQSIPLGNPPTELHESILTALNQARLHNLNLQTPGELKEVGLAIDGNRGYASEFNLQSRVPKLDLRLLGVDRGLSITHIHFDAIGQNWTLSGKFYGVTSVDKPVAIKQRSSYLHHPKSTSVPPAQDQFSSEDLSHDLAIDTPLESYQ